MRFATVTSLIVSIAALVSVIVVYLFMRMNAGRAKVGTDLSGLHENLYRAADRHPERNNPPG
jgi:uncharacterized membrane protein